MKEVMKVAPLTLGRRDFLVAGVSTATAAATVAADRGVAVAETAPGSTSSTQTEVGFTSATGASLSLPVERSVEVRLPSIATVEFALRYDSRLPGASDSLVVHASTRSYIAPLRSRRVGGGLQTYQYGPISLPEGDVDVQTPLLGSSPGTPPALTTGPRAAELIAQTSAGSVLKSATVSKAAEPGTSVSFVVSTWTSGQSSDRHAGVTPAFLTFRTSAAIKKNKLFVFASAGTRVDPPALVRVWVGGAATAFEDLARVNSAGQMVAVFVVKTKTEIPSDVSVEFAQSPDTGISPAGSCWVGAGVTRNVMDAVVVGPEPSNFEAPEQRKFPSARSARPSR